MSAGFCSDYPILQHNCSHFFMSSCIFCSEAVLEVSEPSGEDKWEGFPVGGVMQNIQDMRRRYSLHGDRKLDQMCHNRKVRQGRKKTPQETLSKGWKGRGFDSGMMHSASPLLNDQIYVDESVRTYMSSKNRLFFPPFVLTSVDAVLE